MKGEYYHTKESVEEYTRLAEGFNGAELIDEMKKWLPERTSLLEIGSGPGSDWEILKKTYDVVGSDLSNEFLSKLQEKNPNEIFISLDAANIATDLRFDAIYSNKVLHHLNDSELKNSIVKQSKILNKNGIVCHSFWEGEESEEFKGMFVNYHTKAALTSLFSKYFEILHLEKYAEFEKDDSVLLIAKKLW